MSLTSIIYSSLITGVKTNEKSIENHRKSITRTSDTDSAVSYHHDGIQSDHAEKEQISVRNAVGADGRG